MNVLSTLCLMVFVFSSALLAQDSVLNGKLEYDGVYVETAAGNITKLRPVEASIGTPRLAWYSFSDSDQSCIFRSPGRFIDGKSFFVVRGGWWSDLVKSAEVIDGDLIKSIYVKGSDARIFSVNLIFIYDEFVGDLGYSFSVPTNIPSMEAFGGRVECDLIPLGFTDGGNDAPVISSVWGFWPEQHLLRATIDSATARYDFVDGAIPATFGRDAFELAPNLLDVDNGFSKIGKTANVPFPACGERCRVVGLLIQASGGTFAIVGSDKPY